MNMNETLYGRGRGRGRGRSIKVIPIQGALNKVPNQPTRKTKTSSSPFTRSSSHINWKNRTNSTRKNNSACYTGMTTGTRSSTESESHVIVALSEGRGEAICEVGLAAINITQPTLILCQISDTQSYVNTLTKINIFNPTEILIPLTFVESFTTNRLVEKVKAQFKNVKITGVNRSTFNKNIGMQYVKQLCVANMNSVLLVLQHRYYALAAAAALLSYAEANLYVIYAKESIKIEYQESEGYAIIDVATADRLELVASARPTIKKKYACLFDILNYCYTKVGKLSLRATILQPPCLVPDIEARLECVTELIEHGEVLTDIKIALQKLTKIDQLLTLATVLPEHAQNCSDRQLNYLLLLNSVLEQIPHLQNIFQNCKQSFFADLKATLDNPALNEIKDILRTLINTDVHPAKGKYGTIQRCFAIKSGVNHLLDLVRKSYSERLDEAREYVKQLGEKYSLSLTLNSTQQKGYHIVLTLNAHQKKTLKKCDLPDEFIQVDRLSSTFTMKTQTLIDLSSRIEDINIEILKMSNIMIHKLLIAIRKHIGIFYSLCENISKLDMIQALAQASSNMNYVRPKFANYLEIVQGKHPLLNFLNSVEPAANTVFSSEEYNMNIITGPNGSGKSIFIRQIVLLQIMAQVGCYIPAESATFRVADRILARVYFEDNMTCGASAFALEMKEIQYFLTVFTKNTIIIVDELCRSTSTVEGTAIAMSVCERLLKTPAFVFFTTHFKLLATLYDLSVNVKLWQMETLTEIINEQMILRFTYNIIPGVTSLEHYGLFLAKSSWPENMIKCAEAVLEQLSLSRKSVPAIRQVDPVVRLKYDLESNFKLLKMKGNLKRDVINEHINEYTECLKQLGCVNLAQNTDIFQTSNNVDFLNKTGNICNYYNTEKANTSYQDLSQNLSVILQEKIDYNPNVENNNQQVNIVTGQQLPYQQTHCNQYQSVDENSFIANELNTSYNLMFEPEILMETGGENLYFNITNDLSYHPEELFTENKNTTKVFSRDLNKTIYNTSSESTNQLKFSLPLQYNIERTSTPLAVNFNERFFDQSRNMTSKTMDQLKKFTLNSNVEVQSNMLNKTGTSSILWLHKESDADAFESASYSDNFDSEMLKNSSWQQETENNTLSQKQTVFNQWENFPVAIQNEHQSKKSTTITTSSSLKWLEKQSQSRKEVTHMYPNLQKNYKETTKVNSPALYMSNTQNQRGLISNNFFGNSNNSSSESLLWKNRHEINSYETRLSESSYIGTSMCEEQQCDVTSNLNTNKTQLRDCEQLNKVKPREQDTISASSVKWLEFNNSRINKNTKTSSQAIRQDLIGKNSSSHSLSLQSYFSDAEIAEITQDVQSCSECFFDSDDWATKETNNKIYNLSDCSTDSSLHTGCGGFEITVHAEVHPVINSESNSLLPNTVIRDKNAQTCRTQEINISNECLNMSALNVDKIQFHKTNEIIEKVTGSENTHQLNLNLLKTGTGELLGEIDVIEPVDVNKCYVMNERASVKLKKLNLSSLNTLTSVNKCRIRSDRAINHENDEIKNNVLNNTSLESLGDIHLELFSDKSICEGTNMGTDDAQNDATITNYETAKMLSQSSCDLFITPATPSAPSNSKKRRLDYSRTLDNNVNKESITDSVKPKSLPTPKKTKWNPPYKSLPECINICNNKLKTSTPGEIEQIDYEENDYDNIENRFKNIMNRPTFKQLQQLECIASVRKTEHGVIVLPVGKKKVKSKKNRFISPMLKRTSGEFDVTLLSDKNEQKFEDYLNSSKKSSPFVRTEMSSFQFTRGEVANRQTEALSTVDENVLNNFGRNIQNFKNKLLQKYLDASTINSQNLSQYNENANPGYYTQNKDEIDNLVDKYLNSNNSDEEIIHNSQNKLQNESFNSSIFSQVTTRLSNT